MPSSTYLTHLLNAYHTDVGMGDVSLFYLGNPAVEHYTEWYFQSRNLHILAVNPEGEQIDHAVKLAAALAEHPQQSDDAEGEKDLEETETVAPAAPPSDMTPPDHEHEVKKRDGPTPATLAGVFVVDSDGFFMTADGYYKGPTKYTPDLSKIKLTCKLVPTSTADFAVMHDDSVRCVEEVANLINFAPTMKDRPIGGAYDALNNSVKVGHVPFEPLDRDPQTGDVILDSSHPAGDAAFTMDGYPVQSTAARTELKKLARTHRLVPLPAYGIDGHLINPRMYREALVGALVEARFFLRENYIDKKNMFSADLVAISVIAPPPATSNPLKRKHIPTVFDDCPAKRAARFYDTPGSGPSHASRTGDKAEKN